MTFGLVLLPFAFLIMLGLNKAHRDQTGVNMPSRSAMRGVRRRARKKGISEAQGYSEWLQRKQKRPSNREGSICESGPRRYE